ncbi:MAG: hypothetical protein ACYC3P_05635 [Bellilinea sp.]
MKKHQPPVWVWINLGLALLAVGGYVWLAGRMQSIGFPLDDAWIHQTYARNLADLREWSFVPGVTSAGSTSPLWTVILTLFHLVTTDTPFALTYLMGAVWLWVTACFAELIFRRSFPIYKSDFPPAGVLMVLEWHLVWAGASGMETLLFAALILAVFYLSQNKNNRYGYRLAGLMIGIGVWVRPDALTLLGPLVFMIFFQKPNWNFRLKEIGRSLAAAALPLAAYLIFNYLLSGQIWPNTFYAKQTEYASMREIPFLIRYGKIVSLPLVGVGILLLPGFLYKSYRSIRTCNVYWLAAILWWLGYSLVYALRLPVTYQHGRYLIPAMPVFLLIGLVGSVEGLGFKKTAGHIGRVVRRTWVAAAAIVLAAFLVMGGSGYTQDVAIINTEMVAAAKWLNTNTAADDLIAVHDIGAVGYFTQRRIIDLAGLVTPEVIPIIRDDAKLAQFLDQRKATYLMTFPDWYPILTAGLKVVYQSDGKFSSAAGGEQMTIYRWVPK